MIGKRITQNNHALEVLQHACPRDIQSWPLRIVPGVVHERLPLIVTENCQVVQVVRESNTFNRKPPMRAVMHPTGVMRLHLQGVDERLIKIVVNQVLRKTFVTKLLNHCHDILGRSQSRGSLDVSQNLGIKLIVGNPANFGTLHRIPKSNTLLVCTRSLAVVRQLIREGPFADLINSSRR